MLEIYNAIKKIKYIIIYKFIDFNKPIIFNTNYFKFYQLFDTF